MSFQDCPANVCCRNLFLRVKSQKNVDFALKFKKHNIIFTHLQCVLFPVYYIFLKFISFIYIYTAPMFKLLYQHLRHLKEMIWIKISHLWNMYSNEKDKKLEKNYNYSDKFPGKCNSETHTWTSNIGYCIQAKLQSIYKV